MNVNMERFKKVAAFIPAWGFYILGDLVSRPIHWSDMFGFLLPYYGAFMDWSVFFNDWGGLDVWLEHKDE